MYAHVYKSLESSSVFSRALCQVVVLHPVIQHRFQQDCPEARVNLSLHGSTIQLVSFYYELSFISHFMINHFFIVYSLVGLKSHLSATETSQNLDNLYETTIPTV